MPSPLHESLVLLFRSCPSVVAELFEATAAVRLPSFSRARIASIDRSEAHPATRLADLVIALEEAGERRAAVIVEVQLARDRRKRFTWPLYVASVRAELECDVFLIVYTVEEKVAEWARQPIGFGHPRLVLEPLVVGPRSVPVVTDRQVARQQPELAVLSALAHGEGEHGFAVALAALHAVGHLDEDQATIYTKLVLPALGDAVRARLEEEMRLGNYPEPTDLEKRLLARGQAIGRAEGEAIGRAEAILAVLVARGLEVTDEVRRHVMAERNPDTLSRWLVRAVTVEQAEDVFEPAG